MSVLTHLALIAVLAQVPYGERATPVQALPRLTTRLRPPALAALPPPREAASRPSPSTELPTLLPLLPAPMVPPELALPETAEAPTPPPDPPFSVPPLSIPPGYRPLADLTREPELISPVDENAWPGLPDTPAGTFQLELGIGADGQVDLVVPHCEPALCAAAQTYAGIVAHWRFQPAEMLGVATPSRLRLEFEVGIVAPGARPETHAPRQ